MNQFEQNNTDVVISLNEGGSGAGMAAVCTGQVDIGQASTFYGNGPQPSTTGPTLVTTYTCPTTVAVEIVAYDGVDAIVQTANPHGLVSMNWDTAQATFLAASTSAPTSGSNLNYPGFTSGGPGYFMENGIPAPVQPTTDAVTGGVGYNWDQIPACAAAQTGTTCNGFAEAPETAAATPPTFTLGVASATAATVAETGTMTVTGLTAAQAGISALIPAAAVTAATGGPTISSAITVTSTSYAAGTLTVNLAWTLTFTGVPTFPDALTAVPGSATVNYAGIGTGIGLGAACGADQCEAAGASPCGFAVCAGGTAAIVPSVRSDPGGTTQSFIARDLAIGGSGGTPLGLGFSGCGGDGSWDACNLGYSGSNSHDGNPAVIAATAASANTLGYASDGLVQTGGSGVIPLNFQGYGQSVVVNIQGETNALKAIATGIADHEQNNLVGLETGQAYIGWRPFLNVETVPPTGEALRYLQFVMEPNNNQVLAAEAAEISVYTPALLSAGVPPTPIP